MPENSFVGRALVCSDGYERLITSFLGLPVVVARSLLIRSGFAIESLDDLGGKIYSFLGLQLNCFFVCCLFVFICKLGL